MSDDKLTPIQRLNKDLRAAAITLSADEARFLVDNYYQIQDNRIRADGQVRSITKAAGKDEEPEPHSVLAWFAEQNRSMENQIKGALEKYVGGHPVGTWLTSVHGIGPVISAGLLAHIDIRKAPTAGHIWRFAGLDPTTQWRSREFVKGHVSSSREERGDWEALIKICRDTNKRPLSVLHAAGIVESIPEPDVIREYLAKRDHERVIKAEFHADNLLREALTDDKLPDAYGELFPEVHFDWQGITKTLSKRPWNAQLKVLCWKAGESFVKFSGSEKCFYGHIWKQQKEIYIRRNEQGEFAERSAAILEAKRFNKSTDAYKAYIQGRFPPAHVHAMARRYAVKLFLSHLHGEMYRRVLHREPPAPYPIAILGHTHMIDAPDTLGEGEAA